MNEFYEIRDVTDNDLDKVSFFADKNELLLEGLTLSIFSRMLRWLHSTCEINKRIQIIATSNDGIIAHYGGVPFKMKWNEKSISTVLGSNLVVDKSYRKHSLFFDMQKEFIRSYQVKGYSFAYGAITREGVLNPHLRMGWKSLGTLYVYARPISLHIIFSKLVNNSIISGLLKFPLLILQEFWEVIFFLKKNNVKIQEQIAFDSSMSVPLSEWMSKKKICSERSVEILNWRFSDFKDRGYHIYVSYVNSIPVGYLVARLMPMKHFLSVAIVDLIIFNDDKKVFKALIKRCILFARQNKADLISSALTNHDEFSNLFRKVGFFKSSEKFTVVGHFPKNGVIKYSEFNFSEFHINWFDHDYV